MCIEKNVIIQQVVYAESMCQSRGNGDVRMPLVNRWTVDLFNELEEERLSLKSDNASPKSEKAIPLSVEVIINSFKD